MYYFWSNDQQVGPYTLNEVRAMWNSGHINAQSLYWESGLPEWQPVSAIVHLIQQQEQVLPQRMLPPVTILPKPQVGQAAAVQSTRGESISLPVGLVHQWILNSVFVLALIAFFLPNLSVELPILGKLNFSMLDLLTPDTSGREGASAEDPFSDQNIKPNAWDLIKDCKESLGGIVCGVATLGLLLFYVLTILWGVWFFAFKRTFPRLTLTWLILAVQFPILFSIGARLLISGMRGDISSDTKGNPFAALGVAMVNNISPQPGMVTWLLMLLAIAGIAVPRLASKLQRYPN